MWGRQFIDHIQISAIQQKDIEGRASFYEGMGALRDIVQSHLLQLMSLIMMEAPEKLESEYIHTEKLELLNSVQVVKQNHVDELVVRGQYVGYKNEVSNTESITETYVALKLEVSNSRWGGVPILLRTGKAMHHTSTEINVVFKDRSRRSLPPNILTIRIQPNEGIAIKLTAKKPGFGNEFQPVEMDFNYDNSFKNEQPDAYERVLIDAIAGDQSLFATSAEVLRSWEILEPILQAWESKTEQPQMYEKGNWDPQASVDLAKDYGSEWINNEASG
jgi:glucose-6-phosphate 1-dehydrogenase